MNKKVLLIITIALYLFIGIFALVHNNTSFIGEKYFIAGMITASILPLIAVYITHEYYRNSFKIPYLIIIIAGITIGALFALSNSIDLVAMLITWGIFDIVKASYEIFDASFEIKENKFEIMEIVAGIGEIAFGILLIIHLHHGISHHLIYMGVSFIFIAIKYTIDLFMHHHHDEHEEEKNA
ncbi:MAG: hypothetical protein K6E11_00285 [Bacilli bacterium]|nr:hypothetical protein [Bacilli bacterium]